MSQLPLFGMHANSLKAYEEERGRLGERARSILLDVITHGAGTDRGIMQRMGFPEPNSVRPRITELVKCGLLVETGNVSCPTTGKQVRVVAPKGLP